MKILVVCQYYYPEPFRISDICENLVKKGHTITVLTGLPNYPEGRVPNDYRYGKRRNEVINGVKVIRCFEIVRGKSKIKLFFNYFSYAISASLKALFMKDEFEVVLVNQLSPVMMGIPAMVYKKKNKKNVLFYCLDLWPDSLAAGGVKENSIIYKIFFKISKWIYNSADKILVTSGMFKNYFKDTLEMDVRKIEHLPQYAEDIFIQSQENKELVADILLETKTFNFVFAGNIGDMQSVETIVKAAEELRNNSNVIFHIIGDGSKLDDCKQISVDLALDNVIFYGRLPLNEMPYFYDMADAMLITLKNNRTLSYTLPGKVQSYMAAGKPIIGAINGETRRIIKEAECGLSCDAEDYKGLANLILKFIENEENEKMAINSRNFYLNNYSKEKFLTILEEKLFNLLQN